MRLKLNNAPPAILFIAGMTVLCAETGAVDAPTQWRVPGAGAVDAATSWNYTHAYFFKGPQYSRYNIKKSEVDEDYPKTIDWNWHELWPDGVDAAVNWGSGKALFFKGDEYVRYDTKLNKSDSGYPKRIAGNWPGLWPGGIDAAVNNYGGGVTAPPEELTERQPTAPVDFTETLGCPMLGLFGKEDMRPSPADVEKTEEALKRFNKTYEFHMFDNAGHGFFSSSDVGRSIGVYSGSSIPDDSHTGSAPKAASP